MQTIPSDILEQFSAVLIKRAVPISSHADYRKWLRYYLDFRSKYTLPDSRSEHVRMFIQKLREKGQASEQQKQAADALSLFFESQTKSTLSHCHTKPIPTLTLPLKGREIIGASPLKGEKEMDGSGGENEGGAGVHTDIPRAKKSRYIPVVLSLPVGFYCVLNPQTLSCNL